MPSVLFIEPVLTLLMARGIDDADAPVWMFEIWRRDALRKASVTVTRDAVDAVLRPWLHEVPELVAFQIATSVGREALNNDAVCSVREAYRQRGIA